VVVSRGSFVCPESNFAYPQILCRLWGKGEDFLVNELLQVQPTEPLINKGFIPTQCGLKDGQRFEGANRLQ
jgi:hypothetical protein